MIAYRWIDPQPADVTVPSATAFDVLLGDKAAQHYLIDLRVADADAMAALNQQYRSVNDPTDVLSFPLFESVDALPNTDAPLGDIVICPAMMDAEHLSETEIIEHGVLHLLGFDHETDQIGWNTARQQLTK